MSSRVEGEELRIDPVHVSSRPPGGADLSPTPPRPRLVTVILTYALSPRENLQLEAQLAQLLT